MRRTIILMLCMTLYGSVFCVYGARVSSVPSVRIQMAMEKQKYALGEPQWATITAYNDSGSELGVTIQDAENRPSSFIVSNVTEHSCEMIDRYGRTTYLSSGRKLLPGKSIAAQFLLTEPIRFAKEGIYKVQCRFTFEVATKDARFMITTNVMTDVVVVYSEKELLETMREMRELIKSSNVDMRRRNVRALTSVPSAQALAILRDAACDSDENVARNALYAIWAYKRARDAGWVTDDDFCKARQIIESVLADEQRPAQVRIAAAYFLGEENKGKAMAYLISVVTNSACTNDVKDALFRIRDRADAQTMSFFRSWTNGPVWKRKMIEDELRDVNFHAE